jgi:putative endonuclease
VKVFSHVMFSMVSWAARKGLAPEGSATATDTDRQVRRRTGVRGETLAYWYLRRHGYVMIGRNFMVPGIKGEIDMVGYDGPVLAFVEVKTRTGERGAFGSPEEAVTSDKRRLLSRMARQFLAERRIREAQCRFDVVAIESEPGRPPAVRLHKGAFADR